MAVQEPVKDIAPTAPNADDNLGHYVVRPLSVDDTPDKIRSSLDIALDKLSKLFRAYPTLPADPLDSKQPIVQGHAKDCALHLPNKHCAFCDCNWSGATTTDLVSHLQQRHEK